MPFQYLKPGVTVDEVVNPTFQPFLGDPTAICIIGPARGYEARTEFVQLLDNVAASLSVDDGVDVASVVVQSQDTSLTYSQGSATGGVGPATGRPSGDYYVNGNTLQRSMPTAIGSDQPLVVFYTLDPDGGGVQPFQEEFAGTDPAAVDALLHLTAPSQFAHGTTVVSGKIAGLTVQSRGIYPEDVFTVNLSNGTIVPKPAQLGVHPALFATATSQQVWVDYTDENGVRHIQVPVTLDGSNPVTFLDGADADPTNPAIVLRNSTTPSTDVVVRYASTSASSGLTTPDNGADFSVFGLGTTPRTFTIQRAEVTTSAIGSGDTVKVTYTATPSDYYLPTRVFSQSDVEDKYGPALSVTGAVQSPLTLAAGLAFANGATDMLVLALYHADTVNGIEVRTQGGLDTSSSSDALNLADWRSTLVALRDFDDLNVVVPLVSTGSGNYSDNLSLSAFEAVQDHINYMIDNSDQYLVAVCGEDSTVRGLDSVALAAPSTLQNHAGTLNSRPRPENMVLLSPAGYQYANPANGASTDIGGQYVAAMVSGRLASQGIQEGLTRRQLVALSGVKDSRTESQKDTDAQAGLFVIENKRGVIQVRHAITVAVNDANTRELSVIRAKQYLIEQVKQNIDNLVIGQVVADDAGAFTVQLLVSTVLDGLVSEGVIVTFEDVQARLTSLDPSTVEVRFSYQPAFPLNYVNIKFSINTSSGVVQTDTSTSI